TSFIYNAMHPPLLPGKRYAWCVRAQARDGIDVVNLFENDGYSEVRWFTLQNNCPPTDFIGATAEKNRLSLEWNRQYQHIGYEISYRLLDNATGLPTDSEWTNQEVNDTRATLYGLKGGGTYEYRVGSYCMGGDPVYTPIFKVSLPQDQNRLAQCGI